MILRSKNFCYSCLHLNHCCIFWFCFVLFYGISTIVGYLMPNPFSYICNIYTSKIYDQDIHMHKTFIMFIPVQESENTPDTLTTLFWFRYEIFIYLFEFKVFRHEERKTQFLSMLTFPSDPTTCGTPPQATSLASASSENQLPSSSVESQLAVFFKFQNHQHITSGHDVIHFPGLISYLGGLLWHLWLSHPLRACVDTCTQCVYLTNPCTKLKGSQPY